MIIIFLIVCFLIGFILGIKYQIRCSDWKNRSKIEHWIDKCIINIGLYWHRFKWKFKYLFRICFSCSHRGNNKYSEIVRLCDRHFIYQKKNDYIVTTGMLGIEDIDIDSKESYEDFVKRIEEKKGK